MVEAGRREGLGVVVERKRRMAEGRVDEREVVLVENHRPDAFFCRRRAAGWTGWRRTGMVWSSAFRGRVAAASLERIILVVVTAVCRRSRRAMGAQKPPVGDIVGVLYELLV
jgi:hypothetical protein